jgi:hypothetical protein
MQLPDLIKYKPKHFWNMLKSKDQDISALNLKAFAEYNSKMFNDPTLPEESYTPIAAPATQHITQAELTHTIKHAFKANKSSGLSQMPLQILKHMSAEGIGCVASFLNKSAID